MGQRTRVTGRNVRSDEGGTRGTRSHQRHAGEDVGDLLSLHQLVGHGKEAWDKSGQREEWEELAAEDWSEDRCVPAS